MDKLKTHYILDVLLRLCFWCFFLGRPYLSIRGIVLEGQAVRKKKSRSVGREKKVLILLVRLEEGDPSKDDASKDDPNTAALGKRMATGHVERHEGYGSGEEKG